MPSTFTGKSTDIHCLPSDGRHNLFSLTLTYSQILKNTGLLGSVQVLNVLVSVVRNKAAALLIGTMGMGLSDLYARAVELMSNTTHFGLSLSGVRQISICFEQGRKRELMFQACLMRTWVALAALLGTLLTLALSPLLSLWFFGNPAEAPHLMLLSPAVGFATLAGGEMALLRGLRRLKKLATTSFLVALTAVAVAVPLYVQWGLNAVPAVVLLTSACAFLWPLRTASRLCPYRIIPFRAPFLRKGIPMLKLGLAYVGAGICGSGAEMAIRTALTRSAGGLHAAGLYAAGLTLTVSYARMVFVAMDADYFPRLSAVAGDPQRQNSTVNSQATVLVQIMTPLLLLMALSLPFLVRLLYSSEFLPVIPMVLAALPYMFFKSLFSPVAYLSLAKGDSRTYVAMELVYDVLFMLTVVGGYRVGDMTGAGLGLSLSNAADLVMLQAVCRHRYGYRTSQALVRTALVQGLLLTGGLLSATLPATTVRIACGALCLVLSAAYAACWMLHVRKDRL